MRYIGIDFGRSRIGISVSDEAGSIAFPRIVIANDAHAIDALRAMVAAESVGAVVVGDARTLSGEANTVTAASDAFSRKLEEALTVPVYRAREAWSSMEAARFAPKGKTHDDAAAAAIILQRFLDKKGNTVE